MKQKTKSDKRAKNVVGRFFRQSAYVRLALLVIVMLVFAAVLYPDQNPVRHAYAIGDVVEKDIKAKADFFVQDDEATEAKRREAMDEVLAVYDFDATLAPKIIGQVKAAFGEMRGVIQSYQEAQDTASEAIPTPETAESPSSPLASDAPAQISLHELLAQKKEAFEKKLGIQVSPADYKILEKEGFSIQIQDLITRILATVFENGVVENKEILLRESDRGVVLKTVGTDSERVVTNLRRIYGLDQAKTMVRVVGEPLLKDVDYAVLNLVVDFCQRLLQPNITSNRSEIQRRKQAAAEAIKPIMYKIKAGEMLLREGERVTEVQLLKLKEMQAQTHVTESRGLMKAAGSLLVILCLLCAAYFLFVSGHYMQDGELNRNLTLMASVLVAFVVLIKITALFPQQPVVGGTFSIPALSLPYGIPLAAAAMTICLFLGFETAVCFALVMAACTAIIFDHRFEVFVYFMINSAMGAYWVLDCRERKIFIKAGLKLGLLNILLALVLDASLSSYQNFIMVWDAAFAFILGGILSGMLAAGIAPFAEYAFGYTTDITLLELANLDRPILRRLMIEAPGTYHHSVVVGSLVEAAAAEIGANPLLAKVCGYYHDIGKIKKPLYFIENQTGGKNKHDKLAPSMSSLILIAHVKDGVETARENKLGQAIIDTIRQHHGTSLIKYFYEKARQLKGDDAVDIDAFRYPGPRPQTREAGLVMLADIVEAASRTLENPTPSRIQGLVQNLINKTFSDGQLDYCELTLKDLHSIAKSFNKILNGIHHHRIEYPEKAAATNGKANGKTKDGSSDRQSTKQTQNPPRDDSDEGASRLKRLGIS